MNREILFRGFHECSDGVTEIAVDGQIKRGKWVYGFYKKNLKGTASIASDIDFYWFEVIPETVGQYTGLKDKNGKMIFEGDRIKCVSEIYSDWGKYPTGEYRTEYLEVITKNEDSYEFGTKRVDSNYVSTPILKTSAKKFYEVIGTIYDKELENGKTLKANV